MWLLRNTIVRSYLHSKRVLHHQSEQLLVWHQLRQREVVVLDGVPEKDGEVSVQGKVERRRRVVQLKQVTWVIFGSIQWLTFQLTLTCSGLEKPIDSIHSLIARTTWLMMFLESFLLVSGLMWETMAHMGEADASSSPEKEA